MAWDRPRTVRRGTLLGIGCVLGLAIGCGGAQRPPDSLAEGATEDPPSMECLPQLSPETTAELTPNMRFAWQLSEDAFELEDPLPPSGDADTATIQAWTNGPLQEWLERKNELVEAARAELNQAAEESHDQRTIAGGLVGLLYEDVALVLLRVPVPRDLRNEEPAVLQAYQDVVDAQASPYLEHARRAYDACAANARPHQHLGTWEHFCSARGAGLPLTRAESEAPGTTVEVIAPPPE